MSETTSPSTPSFESHLVRLEEIVARLEGDDVPLEEALALFEEGIAHLREANAVLERAETDVRRLAESDDGTFSLEPLRA